jgi:hypothetical protein
MKKRMFILSIAVLTLTLGLAGCGLLETQSTPTPTIPITPTPEQPVDTPPPQETPPPTEPTPDPAGRPIESILILEPGSGSQVAGPIRLRGEADPTHEQNLSIRVLTAEGEVLLETFTTIQAELGQRGPFEAEIDPPQVETTVFIQVFASSARDGGITHLNSIWVRVAPDGPQDIRRNEPHAETIYIATPRNNQTISGGSVHIEGFALASFEQHLNAEVIDEDGRVVGEHWIIVTAPDLGVPGPFRVDVPYRVTRAGPGRIVVYDPSPAHGSYVHLSSVEVMLEP